MGPFVRASRPCAARTNGPAHHRHDGLSGEHGTLPWKGPDSSAAVGPLSPNTTGWTLEIVKRSDDQKGFVVLPKRWIVERTFGWFGRYRRLSKDYEEQPPSSEAMIRITMIQVMLKRLDPAA